MCEIIFHIYDSSKSYTLEELCILQNAGSSIIAKFENKLVTGFYVLAIYDINK